MKAFSVTTIRPFMAALLTGQQFDAWQLRTCRLGVASAVSIDGAINSAYYTEEENETRSGDFLLWQAVRPVVCSLVKGNRTPSYMNITLAMSSGAYALLKSTLPAAASGALPESLPEGLPEQSWQINIRYERTQDEEGKSAQNLLITTATSSSSFSMDRTGEKVWDQLLPLLLQTSGLELSEV